MRVLLVWPSFVGSNAAGVRGRVLARVLAEVGVDVHVAAFPEPGAVDAVPVPEAAGVGAVTTHAVPLARDPGVGLLGGRRILRRLAEDLAPDLVVCSTPSVLWFVQVEATLGKLAPFVADVRDLGAASLAASFGNKLRYRALHVAETRALRRARAVLAVSGVMKDILRDEYRVPADRLHLVPNGADVAAFEAHAGAGKDVDVLFNGSMLDDGRRGVETVEAFSRVARRRPGTTFRFLGWRRNDYAQDLEARMDALGIRKAVDLVPPVPFEAVPGAVARARIGIVPLQDREVYRTAVGAKTYEYLAAGLPVVALGPRGDTELRRLLQDNGCGVYTDDADAFADALVDLLEDATRYDELAAAALATGARFDRRSLWRDAWRDVLKPLAEGGP